VSTASSSRPAATRTEGAEVDERGDGQLSLDFEGAPPVAQVLLTERQVCGMLSIGRTTLRSLTELRPKHIGRCVRYLLSDVLEYIAELS
jgi:hypothetical protein